MGKWDSAAASRELELEIELPGSLARAWRCGCGRGERRAAGGGGEAGGGDASGPEASNSQPACEAAAPAARASLRPGAGRIDIPRRRVARSTAMHSARDLAGSPARWRGGALLVTSRGMCLGGASRRLRTPPLAVFFRPRASFRNASGVCSSCRAQRSEGSGAVVVDFRLPSSHGVSRDRAFLSIFTYKTTLLPRLVTPAKVPDMAAQLQGMFRAPWGFVSAKIKFITVGSRRNGHPQI